MMKAGGRLKEAKRCYAGFQVQKNYVTYLISDGEAVLSESSKMELL